MSLAIQSNPSVMSCEMPPPQAPAPLTSEKTILGTSKTDVLEIQTGLLPTLKGAGAGLATTGAIVALPLMVFLPGLKSGELNVAVKLIGGIAGGAAVAGGVTGAVTANLTDSKVKGALIGAAVGSLVGAGLMASSGLPVEASAAVAAGIGALGAIGGATGAWVAQKK